MTTIASAIPGYAICSAWIDARVGRADGGGNEIMMEIVVRGL